MQNPSIEGKGGGKGFRPAEYPYHQLPLVSRLERAEIRGTERGAERERVGARGARTT